MDTTPRLLCLFTAIRGRGAAEGSIFFPIKPKINSLNSSSRFLSDYVTNIYKNDEETPTRPATKFFTL
jgi:hypothetical protein